MSERDDVQVDPALARFVEAARTQAIAGTCVTAESVQAGLEHSRRRSHSQRTMWLSAAIAIAASVVVVALLSPLWSQDGEGERPGPERGTDAPERQRVSLGEGSHQVEVTREPGEPAVPLYIELPGRTLELVEGRASIEVSGDEVAVRLHTGVAAWIAVDGRRTQIEVEQVSLDELAPEPAPHPAAELAREADRLLAAGEREQAIETLHRLVEQHPHASPSRAAILDLARLLATLEREREARCAYELYLERWPDSSVSAEVRAQLARLRPAKCSGLAPR